jgi:hypothetical protein
MPARHARRLTAAVLATLAAAALLAVAASPALAITGDHPWLIVRCRPYKVPGIAHTTSYYQKMFTTAGSGTANMTDYWKDVSFGRLSIAGSVVADGAHADAKGWYIEPETEDQIGAQQRGDQVGDCVDEAAQDYNMSQFYGVISIWPGIDTTITSNITAHQTSIPVALSAADAPSTKTMNDFPTPPFGMQISQGTSTEAVTVTAVHDHTLTVQRGQNLISGTTGYIDNQPLAFRKGDEIQTLNDTSYGAATIGQATITINTPDGQGNGTYNLALVNLPSNINDTGASHEMGHGFGLEHSRRISTPTAGYSDFYDIMSAFASYSGTESTSSSNVAYGGQNLLNSPFASKGPGLDAVQVGNLGAMPQNRIASLSLGVPLTFALHSLTDPKALSDSQPLKSGLFDDGLLEADVSTLERTIPIEFAAAQAATSSSAATPEQTCRANHYALEYRESTGPWDSGIPSAKYYWAPKDAALDTAPKAGDFPIGSVILDLPCQESDAQSAGTVDYDYDWVVDTAPAGTGAALSHNADLYGKVGGNDPAAQAPGTFWPGDEFADKKDQVYFAVNEDRRGSREAILTEDAVPIDDEFSDLKPSTAHLDSSVTLSAKLHVKVQGLQRFAADAVIPGHMVTFTLGSQHCSAETALDGKASCSLTVHGSLGKTKLKVRADATRAYRSATASGHVDVLFTLPHPIHLPQLPRGPVPRPPAPNPGRHGV